MEQEYLVPSVRELGGGKKRETSGSCRLLVCTLSHKGEPLSRALSRAFQGTKANDTVPGMSCVCSGSLMVFLRRSYACKRPGLFPHHHHSPPPRLVFVSLTKSIGGCPGARGGRSCCAQTLAASLREPRLLETVSTGLISGLPPARF